MITTTTRVAIIGAGPAGLLMSWALRQAGIDSIVVENRSQEYVLARIRAGVLEQSSTEWLTELGLGERLASEGLIHHGIYLQWGGHRQHIDFTELIGRHVTVYGQQEVVKDLIAAHESAGTSTSSATEGSAPELVEGRNSVVYEAADVAVHDIDASPSVTFRLGHETHHISAELIVGADGFHGISRPAIPDITAFDRHYPYAWLGILADVAPSTDELIYALDADGFAMHSMRSPEVSRLYLQVDVDDNVGNWPDARIWDGLHERLGLDGWNLEEGDITDKSITPMRSFVASRMQRGRLFLVGDAAHIVPPTGAKGLNSAIADVKHLSDAIIAHYAGDDTGLSRYGDEALARQWRVQQFSQWMTELLHRRRGTETDDFDYRSQLGRLDYLSGSAHAQRALAEQYTGLPF